MGSVLLVGLGNLQMLGPSRHAILKYCSRYLKLSIYCVIHTSKLSIASVGQSENTSNKHLT